MPSLFCPVHGFPDYQPALPDHGIRYREPISRNSKTGWYRGNKRVDRDEVARLLEVTTAELISWEAHTDLDAEDDSRAEYGGY